MKQIFAIIALVLVSMSFADANANGRHHGGGGQWHGQGQWQGGGQWGGQYNWNHHQYRRYYPVRPVYPVYPRPIYPAPLPPPIEQRYPYPAQQEFAPCYRPECAPVQQTCYQPECAPVQQVAPCYQAEPYGCPAVLPNTFPAESYYCPSTYCGQQFPGLNVRPVQLPTNFELGCDCQEVRLGGGGAFALIINGNRELARGSYEQVRYMWSAYRQNGVCR